MYPKEIVLNTNHSGEWPPKVIGVLNVTENLMEKLRLMKIYQKIGPTLHKDLQKIVISDRSVQFFQDQNDEHRHLKMDRVELYFDGTSLIWRGFWNNFFAETEPLIADTLLCSLEEQPRVVAA